jgi:hypothetical protein
MLIMGLRNQLCTVRHHSSTNVLLLLLLL